MKIRMVICFVGLLMVVSCKLKQVAAQDQTAQKANNDAISKFMPEDSRFLSVKDFERFGLKEMVSLSELLDKIPGEIVLSITRMDIDMPSVRSFKGIEQFENLRDLRLYNIELDDLREISLLKSLRDLRIENSRINSMKGLSDLQKLELLSLSGTEIIHIEELDIPKSVDALVLSNNKRYREIVERAPDSIEALYLEDNGITSLSDLSGLEYLLKKLNLQEVYIWDSKKMALEEYLATFSGCQEKIPLRINNEY
jgi:hypothetical protein